jgi:hypothetical protein
MITAAELRIGNWILDFGIACKVHPLIIARLVTIENEGKICINIDPIPLTEEVLIKAGFVEQDMTGDSSEWYIPGERSLFSLIKENKFCYNYKTEINYLHQLQNLHYVLTSKELEIKKL